MGDPVLHLLAGPNGSGKSTFCREVLLPVTGLAFINADDLAAIRWPGAELEHAYEASERAAKAREEAIERRESFATETVFSHPSKLALVNDARAAGYLVTLHVVLVPVELAVARVRCRVAHGGHDVPEEKIRARCRRQWPLIVEAVAAADEAFVYDNSRADRPFRKIASFIDGRQVGESDWPRWTPAAWSIRRNARS